jgi:hypothetical protein
MSQLKLGSEYRVRLVRAHEVCEESIQHVVSCPDVLGWYSNVSDIQDSDMLIHKAVSSSLLSP